MLRLVQVHHPGNSTLIGSVLLIHRIEQQEDTPVEVLGLSRSVSRVTRIPGSSTP